MNESLVFLDIDTQVDFMLPQGSLYVPGAVEIIPNLERLMKYAREYEIPVISSADVHPADDPSFSEWPPHCVVGTPGQKRIPQTLLPSPTVIPNRPGTFRTPAQWTGQFIVEKQEYDVSTNVNFGAILASLGPRRFVAFGVATDYCVRWSVMNLRKRGIPVDLVPDAIKAITEKGEREALQEMAAAGIRRVSAAEVCAGAAAHGSRVR
jgi:nicotinamidase/pyrazinamidase